MRRGGTLRLNPKQNCPLKSVRTPQPPLSAQLSEDPADCQPVAVCVAPGGLGPGVVPGGCATAPGRVHKRVWAGPPAPQWGHTLQPLPRPWPPNVPQHAERLLWPGSHPAQSGLGPGSHPPSLCSKEHTSLEVVTRNPGLSVRAVSPRKSLGLRRGQAAGWAQLWGQLSPAGPARQRQGTRPLGGQLCPRVKGHRCP